jgi:LITAF-like zinc ribbon domain
MHLKTQEDSEKDKSKSISYTYQYPPPPIPKKNSIDDIESYYTKKSGKANEIMNFMNQRLDPFSLKLKSRPSEVVCPLCKEKIVTIISKKPGASAWNLCLTLCCLCFPFCLCPLFCEPCSDTLHKCPKCAKIICITPP